LCEQQPAENSGSSTSSGGSNYGTLGRSPVGMASMMDEMAKTLARRRAACEAVKKEALDEEQDRRQWDRAAAGPGAGAPGAAAPKLANGAESPKPNRKRFGSSSEENLVPKVNGTEGTSCGDLESFKQDILREMRQEIARMKQDIISGTYILFS